MSEKFFFMHGQATPELKDFTTDLLSILTGNTSTLKWRSPDSQRHYLNLRKDVGETRIANRIQSRMLGHMIALLENDFPYDGIMPFGGETYHSGGELAHYCLWSVDANLLVPKNVDKVIDVNFPQLSALVFMHDTTNKSIKLIEHVHIVIDAQRRKLALPQRYFEVEDFA